MAVSVKHLKASDGSELEVKGAEYANSAKNIQDAPSFASINNDINITVAGQQSANFTIPYATKSGASTSADYANALHDSQSGNNITISYSENAQSTTPSYMPCFVSGTHIGNINSSTLTVGNARKLVDGDNSSTYITPHYSGTKLSISDTQWIAAWKKLDNTNITLGAISKDNFLTTAHHINLQGNTSTKIYYKVVDFKSYNSTENCAAIFVYGSIGGWGFPKTFVNLCIGNRAISDHVSSSVTGQISGHYPTSDDIATLLIIRKSNNTSTLYISVKDYYNVDLYVYVQNDNYYNSSGTDGNPVYAYNGTSVASLPSYSKVSYLSMWAATLYQYRIKIVNTYCNGDSWTTIPIGCVDSDDSNIVHVTSDNEKIVGVYVTAWYEYGYQFSNGKLYEEYSTNKGNNGGSLSGSNHNIDLSVSFTDKYAYVANDQSYQVPFSAILLLVEE